MQFWVLRQKSHFIFSKHYLASEVLHTNHLWDKLKFPINIHLHWNNVRKIHLTHNKLLCRRSFHFKGIMIVRKSNLCAPTKLKSPSNLFNTKHVLVLNIYKRDCWTLLPSAICQNIKRYLYDVIVYYLTCINWYESIWIEYKSSEIV